MAAPIGAEVELQDTAVPIGTEVLHVYSTGLNGSLPRDMPAEQSAATFHLRGAYGPSLSRMYADQGSQPASEAYLPRAPLRSHAEYLEFCRCLLDEDGHRCWREMLDALGITDPEAWVRYAAKYATLPPLPAQLALPAPAWSMVSSTVLLYLQPSLLAALADRMHWAFEPHQQTEVTMHFAGFSAGSYTAIALEVDYRLCVGTSNSPSAQAQLQWELLVAQCSIWLRSFPPPSSPTQPACSLLSGHCVYHMSGKTLSVFGGLRLMSSSPCLHPFGRKTPVRLCSSKFLTPVTLSGLNGLDARTTIMLISPSDYTTQSSLSSGESHAEGLSAILQTSSPRKLLTPWHRISSHGLLPLPPLKW